MIRCSGYFNRQAADVQCYGAKKEVLRTGVPKELVEELTPHRRLSNRPCSLSDPTYFIEQFEQAKGKNFLPENWDNMTNQEKINYIVTDRYSSLVAYRAMDKLHQLAKNDDMNLQVERLISLDESGNIVEFNVLGGNGKPQVMGNDLPNVTTCIHSHPALFDEEELSVIGDDEKPKNTFSVGDVRTSIQQGVKSYVVDDLGHRFVFEPAKTIDKIEENGSCFSQAEKRVLKTKAQEICMCQSSDDEIFGLAKFQHIHQLNNAKSLQEWTSAKLKILSQVYDSKVRQIMRGVELGLCRYTELGRNPNQ